MSAAWEAVIGLEVHVQVGTSTKMFCGCANTYGFAPNSQTCPVCLGLPGTLPVLNREAVRKAIGLGLALGATIQSRSSFYRKQYFYADLPKGYQITQGPVALVEGGSIRIPGDPVVRGCIGSVEIGIERAHLEEDAGKSTHEHAQEHSLVDLNRAGVPLLEVVGRPDLRSPQEASDFLKALHHLVTYLKVSDGNMEEGNLRCDANVSIRSKGSATFGTRVEIKNLNSFRYVRQALEYEIQRQCECLERGVQVLPETRGWDGIQTVVQRSKEGAMDYRYFPEPDLPDLDIHPGEVDSIRESLPEPTDRRAARYREKFGLTEYESNMMVQSPGFASFFDAVVQAGAPGKQACNWILGEISRSLNERGCALDVLGLAPEHLARLIQMVEGRVLNLTTAREQVFPALIAGEGAPDVIAKKRGLAQVADEGAVRRIVEKVLEAHPEQVAQFRAGQVRVRGFLVGQVMKAGKGQLDPKLTNGILDDCLQGGIDEPV